MIDVLSRVLCLKKPKLIRNRRLPDEKACGHQGGETETQSLRGSKETNGSPPEAAWDNEVTVAISTLERVCSDTGPTSPKERVQMRNVVEAMRGYMNEKSDDSVRTSRSKYINEEWKFVALVLDRVFLVIYIVVIVISLVFLFPR